MSQFLGGLNNLCDFLSNEACFKGFLPVTWFSDTPQVHLPTKKKHSNRNRCFESTQKKILTIRFRKGQSKKYSHKFSVHIWICYTYIYKNIIYIYSLYIPTFSWKQKTKKSMSKTLHCHSDSPKSLMSSWQLSEQGALEGGGKKNPPPRKPCFALEKIPTPRKQRVSHETNPNNALQGKFLMKFDPLKYGSYWMILGKPMGITGRQKKRNDEPRRTPKEQQQRISWNTWNHRLLGFSSLAILLVPFLGWWSVTF